MRRRWRILIAIAVAAAILLAINALVVEGETKRAAVSAPGGQLLELSGADLQVVDQPASDPDASGAPIVLLHGYAGSLRWWDRLVPLLEGQHRIVRLDLIGHGGSAKPGSGYGIPEQAAAVAEALNRLEVEAATVVGHSMGGVVATALAERASELVDRVALLGTGSRHDSGSYPLSARLAYLPVIGPGLWRLRPDALIRSAYGSAFAPGFDPEGAFEDPDQVIDDSRTMTYTSYERARSAGDDFLRQRTLPSRLTEAAVPALAILGSEDQILDATEVSADLEGIPGTEVQVLEGVGHSPNLEAPEETAELLLRFAGAAVSPGEGRARRQRGAG